MASIDPAILNPALAAARHITLVVDDAQTAPPFVVTADGAAAGEAVAVMSPWIDGLDVKAQIAEQGWAVVAVANSDAKGQLYYEYRKQTTVVITS